MEILLAFLLALGLIFEGESYSNEEIEQITTENHDLLVREYGEEYLSIIGDDHTDK